MKRKSLLIIVLVLTLLAVVGCGGVPQEEHDQVKNALTASETEVETLQGKLAEAQSQAAETQAKAESLQSELKEAQDRAAEAEAKAESMQQAEDRATEAEAKVKDLQSKFDERQEEIEALQQRMELAKAKAEILNIFFTVGLSGGKGVDPFELFMELSEKLENSGDEVLQAKFQALIEGEGGEQEAQDLFLYIIQSLPEDLDTSTVTSN